ncbi:GNAT family N-acetyltransferase [Nocardia sp. NRRL S-836]|uniref:GNAT family N-acetyltransferase n=1 Tax=Nocardia sp. NRRL S-836 TaxID=1519492 RepID=UPI0006AF8B67|nr:GNAT family N-acetyltransferase [Nocardia sp. NRRL S-836]KOV81109.1 acetyltransferase [Nocardia sp. NRRL S-836]
MADVLIRPAREADLAAVGAITVEAYRADGYVADTDDYAAHLADATTRFHEAELLVAVDAADGELLGSVTVVLPGTPFAEVSEPGEAEFRMLSVAAAARGRGVGEALVRAVLDRARALGADRVVLSSSEKMLAAHRLYGRLGFTRLPDRDWFVRPGAKLLAYALPL